MEIQIKISGGTAEEQKQAVARLQKTLINLRRAQKANDEPKTEYKIKAKACRGVKSAGWKGEAG